MNVAATKRNPRFNDVYYYYKKLIFDRIQPSGRGLEVGSFDKPFVERHEARIEYADVFSTEELRKKCAALPGHDPSFVVTVDHVLANAPLSGIPGRFDFVIASHVIEHTPNMIGWLADVSGMLNPGGRLLLVIPDKRYTFDVFKAETTLLDLIERMEKKADKPSFRSILETLLLSSGGDPTKARSGIHPPRPERNVRKAIQDARTLAARPYHDVHCNIFNDNTFRQLMTELKSAELLPFTRFECFDRQNGFVDFFCALYK